jgi:uncharacterized protein with FMN-binding domain
MPQALNDGEFSSGEHRGMFGPVTAVVTVAGGRITRINATHPEETAYIGAYAIRDIIAGVIAKQDVNVDTVGGATASSNAIRFAIEEALKKAAK